MLYDTGLEVNLDMLPGLASRVSVASFNATASCQGFRSMVRFLHLQAFDLAFGFIGGDPIHYTGLYAANLALVPRVAVHLGFSMVVSSHSNPPTRRKGDLGGGVHQINS